MHTPLRSVTTLAFACMALVAGTAPAVAADTTVSACVGKATGVMRYTDAGTGCRSGESLLTWNVQGPQGAPGPQGPAGPQTMINAVVNPDGSLAASGVPAGATLTVTRNAPGSFQVLVTGLGTSCPLPMAMAYGTNAVMSMGGGYCSAGTLSINILNSSGTESGFVLLVTALGPATANTAAAARTPAITQFNPR